MYMLSVSTPVNPEGAQPTLTAEQVWAGLVMKAENALPFVPLMKKCDLVERTDNSMLRSIVIGNDALQEFITLYAPVQVKFERVGTDDFILNTISDSPFGLLLTFTFGISFSDVQPGSPEERQKGEAMRKAYADAIGSTLACVRDMVSSGRIRS